MILREFFEAAPAGWQEIEDDQSQLKWGETRKTKLTLGMISKLRKMNDVQAYERAQDLKKIRAQYKPPAGDGAPSL
jgi:hypothetical protein